MSQTFDCVKLKDEAQQRRATELAGLSEAEILQHYRGIHEDLQRRQRTQPSRRPRRPSE